MLRWRNETQPPVPVHISMLADALSQSIWVQANTYEITCADENAGTIEKSAHQLQAWAVNIQRKQRKNESTLLFLIENLSSGILAQSY